MTVSSTWWLILFFSAGYSPVDGIRYERIQYNVTIAGFPTKAACEARGEVERKVPRPGHKFERYLCIANHFVIPKG